MLKSNVCIVYLFSYYVNRVCMIFGYNNFKTPACYKTRAGVFYEREVIPFL